MIPKKLHYVWIGDKKTIPNIEKKWMNKAKTLNPDWEVNLWSEKDVPNIPFLEWVLEKGRYWAASDYIRLYILQKEGGIYIDTDVELLKPFSNEILQFENVLPRALPHFLSNYFIGSTKNSRFIREVLKEYKLANTNIEFDEKYWSPTLWINIVDRVFGKYSIRNSNDSSFKSSDRLKVLPENICCPYYPKDLDRTGDNVNTKDSLCIHYFNNYKTENNIDLINTNE